MLYIIREASGERRILHNGVEIEGFWGLDYKQVEVDTAVEITLTTILSKDVQIIEKEPDLDQMFGKKPKERTKPKFYIEDYKGKFVMHCNTREKLKKFCKFLIEKGVIEDFQGEEVMLFQHITKAVDICINFNEKRYSSVEYCNDEGYTILEFDNFDWEE